MNVDIVILAFLNAINGPGGKPQLNFANQGTPCDQSTTPFTCPEIEADIKECQNKKKTVLLSIGGGSSLEKGWADAGSGTAAAHNLWQMFGPDQANKSVVRPFGAASVNGFDFDLEGTVSNSVAFGKTLRADMDLYQTQHPDQQFYLAAAPMCGKLSQANDNTNFLESVKLDIVSVQFYNDPSCDTRAGFNLAKWSDWAKSKNTTFLVGLPAGSSATTAGEYVAPDALKGVLAKAKGLEKMGGAMLWDATQAWSNSNYHVSVKDALTAA